MTNLYSNHTFSVVGSTFSSLAQSYFYLLWKNELPSKVKSQETGFRHPVRSSMHGSARRHTAHPSETHVRAVRHQMPQSVHKTQPLWYRVCPLFLLNFQLIKLNSQMVSQTTEDRKTEHLPTHFPECWGYEGEDMVSTLWKGWRLPALPGEHWLSIPPSRGPSRSCW